LDLRLDRVRLKIPSAVSVFRSHGEISPEAQALAAQTLNNLELDVYDTHKRSGLDGVDVMLTEYETKTVPELEQRCAKIQNAFMIQIAAERNRQNTERALSNAGALSPDKALRALENSGLRFRVHEGELETAGPIDDFAMACLKIHRGAFVACWSRGSSGRELPYEQRVRLSDGEVRPRDREGDSGRDPAWPMLGATAMPERSVGSLRTGRRRNAGRESLVGGAARQGMLAAAEMSVGH
jgi:hypothetical protein